MKGNQAPNQSAERPGTPKKGNMNKIQIANMVTQPGYEVILITRNVDHESQILNKTSISQADSIVAHQQSNMDSNRAKIESFPLKYPPHAAIDTTSLGPKSVCQGSIPLTISQDTSLGPKSVCQGSVPLSTFEDSRVKSQVVRRSRIKIPIINNRAASQQMQQAFPWHGRIERNQTDSHSAPDVIHVPKVIHVKRNPAENKPTSKVTLNTAGSKPTCIVTPPCSNMGLKLSSIWVS